jgi:hypothetical protein
MYDSRIEDIRDTITAIKIDLHNLDYEQELLTVSEYNDLRVSIELKLDNIQDALNSLDPSK